MRLLIPLAILSLNMTSTEASTLARRSPCAADLAAYDDVVEDVPEVDHDFLGLFTWARGRTLAGGIPAWVGRAANPDSGEPIVVYLYRYANGSLGMNLQFNLADAADFHRFRTKMRDRRFGALGLGFSDRHTATSRAGDVLINFAVGSSADYRLGTRLTAGILASLRAGGTIDEGFGALASGH